MLYEHMHLKNVLDGCFSSFVISNKYINHHVKKMFSNLMKNKSAYEKKKSCISLFFFNLMGTFIYSKMMKKNLSYLTWLQWHAFLRLSSLIVRSQPVMAWYETPVSTDHFSDRPSITCLSRETWAFREGKDDLQFWI